MLEIGTQLQGRYVIEEQIGQGGMGAVYLAVDQKFSVTNRVAIKETFYETPELAEAFEREARLLNSLHHPILPHVSDYFTEGGGSFLVMEYIEGEDLSQILKREGAFPVADVTRWTRDILDGLDYLHSQEPPIIHRDIKPNNLKLTTRGFIVLLDFGLAKENEEATISERSIFGYSRRYSPLEQIEGVGTDARSDIFSLGATAYHLLTGRPPVDALARASAIVSGQPDPLELASDINSDIPEPLARVLHSALALNADQRFASAKAMSAAIEYALNPEAAVAAIEGAADVEPRVQDAGGVLAFPALQAFKAENGHDDPNSTDGESDVPIASAAPAVEKLEDEQPPFENEPTDIVVDEPVETIAAQDLGTADSRHVDTVDREPESEISEGVSPERPATAGMVIPTDGASHRPGWQRGVLWASLIFAGLLALIYGISHIGAVGDGPDTQDQAIVQPAEEVQAEPESANEAATVAEPDGSETAAAEPAKAAAPKTDQMAKQVAARVEESDRIAEPTRPSSEPVAVEVAPARNRAPARTEPAPKRSTDRAAQRNNRDAEPGVPVSSIESVFTGLSYEDARREARRRAREDRIYDGDELYRQEMRRRGKRKPRNDWPF